MMLFAQLLKTPNVTVKRASQVSFKDNRDWVYLNCFSFGGINGNGQRPGPVKQTESIG